MSVNKARSQLAIQSKKAKAAGVGAASPAVQDARRQLAEEKLKKYIEQTVASAPPLTVEQRDRLSVLLRTVTP